MKQGRMKAWLVAMAIALPSAMWADGNYCLKFWFANGQTKTYLLSDKPEVSFPKGKTLEFKSVNASATYNSAEVTKFTIEDAATDIEEVMANETSGSSMVVKCLDGSHVSVRGIGESARVKVFSVQGAVQKAEVSTVADGADIDLSSLANGTYVISINGNESFKVYKR